MNEITSLPCSNPSHGFLSLLDYYPKLTMAQRAHMFCPGPHRPLQSCSCSCSAHPVRGAHPRAFALLSSPPGTLLAQIRTGPSPSPPSHLCSDVGEASPGHTKQIGSPAPVSSLTLPVSLTALHLTLDIQLFMVRFPDCKFDALKAGTLLCFVCRQTRSAYSRIWQARLLHAGCCRRQKLPRSCLRDGRCRAEGDLTLVPEPD